MGTRALCEYIARYSTRRLEDMSCREPAANRGHMVRPLLEYFGHIMASDVHDYGAGYITPPLSSHAELLEFFNCMLDVLTGERAAAEADDARRIGKARR